MTRLVIVLLNGLALVLSVLALAKCDSNFETWSDQDRRTIESMRWSAAGPVPDSPSNRVADAPAAVELGRRLFFDRRLSASGTLSCASCHQPDRFFTDGRPIAQGAGSGRRNTPTVVGAGYGRWFYWDGRRDSLWSQALIPFEAADEMGGSRTHVLRVVLADDDYRGKYEAVFGALPGEGWRRTLPAQAGPFGASSTREAWYRLGAPDQRRINEIYANLGKAIAAFERTLVFEPGPFDRYAEALAQGRRANTLNASQRRGLALFIADRTRCLRCHNGPLLTNGGFHNVGTGSLKGTELDFGRLFGIQAVLMDEFNCLGPYSDAPRGSCSALRFLNRREHQQHLGGAFKVPSLRGVSKTAPYFHDGRFATLTQVVEFYNAPQTRIDGVELEPIGLSPAEIQDLVAFLEVL